MSSPNWPGAESVYARLLKLATEIQTREYAAQRAKDKRKSFRFVPNIDGLAISAALNRGDEEECKALLATHMYVLGVYLRA